MLTIQLVYDSSCPNVHVARDNLKKALTHASISEAWKEIDISSMDCPDYAKNSGSPSIFINQKDVSTSHLDGEKECCRNYQIRPGKTGVAPTVEMINDAINKTQ